MKQKLLILALLLINLIIVQGFFMPAHAQLVFTPSPKANGTGSGLVFIPNGTKAATTAPQTSASVTPEQLAAANAQVAYYQGQYITALAQLRTAQGALSSAQTALAAVQITANLVPGLQASVASLNTTITGLNSTIAGLNANVTTLSATITSLQATNATLVAANAALMAGSVVTRTVWAHSIPTTCPTYDYPLGSVYGSDHPLIITGSTGVGNQSTYQQALNAGIDAVSVDCGTSTPSAVQSTMLARLQAGKAIGLKFALCIDRAGDTLTESQIITAVKQQITAYSVTALTGDTGGTQFTSAAVDASGNLIIWTYNATNLTGADWAQIKSDLAAQSPPVHIVLYGDAGGAYLQAGGSSTVPTLTAFTNAFDLTYQFGAGETPNANAVFAGGLVQSGKPFAWTVRPSTAPGYTDATGTQTLQYTWGDAFNKSFLLYPSQCRTVEISTFDDFSEMTNVMPDSDYGDARSEENACEAALFKGQSFPISTPRVYLTVPQALYEGAAGALATTGILDATVINPTSNVLMLTVKNIDLHSNAVGSQWTNTIPPNSITPTTTLFTNTTANQTAFTQGITLGSLRMQATLTVKATGQVLVSSITSAPCALYPVAAPSGVSAHLNYYSVCSAHTLGFTFTGAVNIHPGTGQKSLTLTLQSGTPTPRVLELLHNTRRAAAYYNTGSISNINFSDLNSSADDRGDDSQDEGYYVLRVIDSFGNEGYLGPIGVTHN